MELPKQSGINEGDNPSLEALLSLASLEDQAKYEPEANAVLITKAREFLNAPPKGVKDSYVALVKFTLGKAYLRQSPDPTAETRVRSLRLFEEAGELIQKENDPVFYAHLLLTTGQEYIALNTADLESNQHNALRCFSLAESALAKLNDSALLLAVRTSLANVMMKWVGPEKEGACEKAIQILEQILADFSVSKSPDGFATLHSTLARAYMARHVGSHLKNLYSAVTHFEQSIDAGRTLGAEYDARITLSNSASAYISLYDRRKDDKYLDKAIDNLHTALALSNSEADPGTLAAIFGNLGSAYSRLPESHAFNPSVRVPRFFLRSIEFAHSASEPETILQSSRKLGIFYAQRQNWKDARQLYQLAVVECDGLRNKARSRASKASVMAETHVVYDEAAYVYAKAGYQNEALAISDHGRATFLSERMPLRTPRPEGVSDDLWDEFEKSRYAFVINEWEQSANRNNFRTYSDWYDRAVSSLGRSINAIRAVAPMFCSEPNLQDLGSIVNDPSACIVSFCITQFGTLLFLIQGEENSRVEVVEVPTFTESSLSKLLFSKPDETGEVFTKGWLAAYVRIVEGSGSSLLSWLGEMDEVLADIGTTLLGPVVSALSTQTRRIILIPCGRLGVLPLHAAPLDETHTTLWDRYEVSYSPSLRVLAECVRLARLHASGDSSLYAAINPTAESGASLPFSEYEGRLISKVVSSGQFDWGKNATRETVVVGMGKSNRLHIASHSVFDWRRPRQSGISTADGVLNLDELIIGEITTNELDFGVQLARQILCQSPKIAALSACETGMSDFYDGSPSEFLGIPAGFMLVGYPTVVSSLWIVNDVSCALLMSRFYQELEQGRPTGAALRAAALWLRSLTARELRERFAEEKNRTGQGRMMSYHDASMAWRRFAALHPDEKPFLHPFHYAAFTVTGDTWNIVK